MSDIDRINLDLQLQTCIENYQCAIERYWESKLDAEEWIAVHELCRDAHQIAEMLRKRAFALQNVGDKSIVNDIYRVYDEERKAAEDRRQQIFDRFRDKLKGEDARKFKEMLNQMFTAASDPEEETDRPLHLVWQYLCVEDAWETVEDIRGRVRRVFELEQLVEGLGHRTAIPDATKQFLALVGRTFVWGFDSECVIVCRSSIDTAFRESVPDALVEKVQSRERNHEYSLAARINAAYAAALIPKEICAAATRIRERGRKAVHYDPTATEAILETVRDTLAVVDHLAKLKKPEDRVEPTGES